MEHDSSAGASFVMVSRTDGGSGPTTRGTFSTLGGFDWHRRHKRSKAHMRTDGGSGPLSLPLLQHDMSGDTAADVELAAMDGDGARDGGGDRRRAGAAVDDMCPATAWELKLRLACDVACGMSFIHSLGKVHRLVGLYVFGGGCL